MKKAGRAPVGGSLPASKGGPLERARINLTWLSRAIEYGVPLEKAIEEVYSMKIYGFAGDLRTLLKEIKP
jgi:hypothetical protein